PSRWAERTVTRSASRIHLGWSSHRSRIDQARSGGMGSTIPASTLIAFDPHRVRDATTGRLTSKGLRPTLPPGPGEGRKLRMIAATGWTIFYLTVHILGVIIAFGPTFAYPIIG